MTISVVYGFNNLTTQDKHSRFHVAKGIINGYKHGVVAGFHTSPTATARTVQVIGGEAIVAGTLVTANTTTTVQLDVGGGSARTDLIVLEVDWSLSASPDSAATIKVIKGTSTTTPSTTQTPGVKWQMPLARVSVPASHTGVFTTSQVVVCKPLPYLMQAKSASSFTDVNVDNGNPAVAVATLNFDDPGWLYRIQVNGAMVFEATGDGGYGVILARVGASEIIARGRTWPRLAGQGQSAAEFSRIDQSFRSGPASVSLLVAASGSTDNILTDHTSGYNAFDVALIPAW